MEEVGIEKGKRNLRDTEKEKRNGEKVEVSEEKARR